MKLTDNLSTDHILGTLALNNVIQKSCTQITCLCLLYMFFVLFVLWGLCFDCFPIYAGCLSNQFKCNNGLCISETFRCDGYSDCEDDSDEVGCCEYLFSMQKQHTVQFHTTVFMNQEHNNWFAYIHSLGGIFEQN